MTHSHCASTLTQARRSRNIERPSCEISALANLLNLTRHAGYPTTHLLAIAVAIRIRSQADFGAGVLIIVVAVGFLLVGASLPQGTALEMGPGYFPRMAAWLALLVGVLVLLRSLKHDGPVLARFRWRPFLMTIGAVLCFGFCIARFGLLLTAPAVLLIAASGVGPPPAGRLIAMVLLVTAGVALVFVQLLGLTIPLWPGD